MPSLTTPTRLKKLVGLTAGHLIDSSWSTRVSQQYKTGRFHHDAPKDQGDGDSAIASDPCHVVNVFIGPRPVQTNTDEVRRRCQIDV